MMTRASDPFGTGKVAVDQTPLRTTFLQSHSRFVLSWRQERVLEIKGHRVVRGFALGLCILGLPVLLLGIVALIGGLLKPAAADFVAAGFLLLWGGPMGLLGLWLLGPRHRFDKVSGSWTRSHLGRTRRWPLERIVAVQMIEAGRFGSKYNEGLSDQAQVEFPSYQLNMVLDDPHEPRLFVAYNSDETDMARKAQLVADFLRVPLIASPHVHELLQSFSEDNAQIVQGTRRFHGSDTLRSVRDRQLPEPYRSWIDDAWPLPTQVRVLQRSVSVVHDLSIFVILGGLFLMMDGIVLLMFLPALKPGASWTPLVLVGSICLLIAIVPLVLLRRLWITFGAWRHLKKGTLRQGILVGPAGILVRMEPNRCYVIPLERFVQAKVEDAISPDVPADFVVQTLDGRVAFFFDRSSGPPELVNRWVAELRSKSNPAR